MTLGDWVVGARPRTLWTAVTAVAVGTASAHAVGGAHLVAAVLALAVAVAFQVAVNYANDYSDGVRGTDATRLGPDRLVATGRATPTAVKRAAYASFAAALVTGAALVVVSSQWWLVAVGVIAVVAAWTYTGSDRPYGYAGWGEVSVWVFFGPVAVLGTMLTQTAAASSLAPPQGAVTWWAVVASAAVGLWAVALLMVNNIRDIDGDTVAGKRTLAVRLGAARAKVLFCAVVLAPTALAVVVGFARPWALLAGLTALPALLLCVGVVMAPRGSSYALFFRGISATGLAYGLLLALGIAW